MQKLLSAVFLLCILFVVGTTSAPTAAELASTEVKAELAAPVVLIGTESIETVKEGYMADNLSNNYIIENPVITCLKVGQHCKSGGDCCSKRCLTYAGKCVT